MKKIAWSLLLLALPLFTFAQELPMRSVRVTGGIKLGANLTALNATHWDNGYKANFLGGVVLGVRAAKVGVQAEGLFVQTTYTTGTQGAQLPGMLYQNLADSAREGSFRLNQLSVPLLFMLRLPGGIWLQAGPQYNHTLSVNDKEKFLKNPEELFKSDDISGVVGLELLAGRHFTGGARYLFGFTDINNYEGAKDAWKSKAIQLYIGYVF